MVDPLPTTSLCVLSFHLSPLSPSLSPRLSHLFLRFLSLYLLSPFFTSLTSLSPFPIIYTSVFIFLSSSSLLSLSLFLYLFYSLSRCLRLCFVFCFSSTPILLSCAPLPLSLSFSLSLLLPICTFVPFFSCSFSSLFFFFMSATSFSAFNDTSVLLSLPLPVLFPLFSTSFPLLLSAYTCFPPFLTLLQFSFFFYLR